MNALDVYNESCNQLVTIQNNQIKIIRSQLESIFFLMKRTNKAQILIGPSSKK